MNDADKTKEQLLADLAALRQQHAAWEAAETQWQRTEAELQRREASLQHLADIGKIISSSLHIEEVYQRFATEVRKLLPFDRISIATLDLEQERVTITYTWGPSAPRRRPGDEVSLPGTISAVVMRTATGVLVQIEDADELARRFPGLLPQWEIGMRSFMALPLRSHGRIIGVLNLHASRPHAYTRYDLHLAESVSSQIAGAIANARHYAEHQRDGAIIRESETRFRHLIEGSIQGIIIHQDLKPLFVNQAYADMYGYETPEDILQMGSILPLIAPHEQDRLARYRDARLQGEKDVPSHYEHQAVRKDGTLFWVESQIRVVTWEGGSAVQATNFDVTDRKQGEEALQESEARYRALVEQSVVGVYITQDTHFQYVNPRYAEIFGYTPEELLATVRFGSDLIIPEDRVLLQEHVRKRQQGEEEFSHYTCRGLRKDGTWVTVEFYGTSMILNGKPVNIGTVLDITERKLAEEQIKNHNLLLEQAVQEKTQEMEALSAYLIQQEKLATIGQMSASIAHEIRNPLAAVRNAAYYLKRHVPTDTPKLVQYLEIIEQEVQVANRVISDILEMSRAKEPLMASFDLARLARDVFARMDANEAVRQHLVCRPDPFPIVADQGQLRQVMENLVLNAVQAINGNGAISVDIRRADDHDLIAVRDNGPGIDAAHRHRLFEPLFSAKAKGTGLGLTICRQIVERHGGTIDVQDHEGCGALFCVRLPRHSA